MDYKNTLDYLMEQLPMFQRIGKLAYRSGLDNTLKLDAHFSHPHRSFITIHVAGTNGKGSVSHMLASVLQEAGFTVGLYTSPHLLDFRERIRVNGNMISTAYIAEFVTLHKPYFDTLNSSFFEISVFLAFEWFKKRKVDIAVIEVGLGGRLDATNVIAPVLSVITNIGMDHTEILGDTLEKIAFEKAGIIKHATPVVAGESQLQVLPVFRQVAAQQDAPLYLADEVFKIDYSMTSVDGYQVFQVRKNGVLEYPNLKCGLLGHYQRKNTVTVLAALEQLHKTGVILDARHIYSGIQHVIDNTGLNGRWQIVRHHPDVIIDTAHNADGLKQVVQQLSDTPFEKLHLILGFVNDKDIHEMLKCIPAGADYYFTRLSVPRTTDENDLAATASQFGLKGPCFARVGEAYRAAKEKAGVNDLIVITGSNFLVADFLRYSNEKRKVKNE